MLYEDVVVADVNGLWKILPTFPFNEPKTLDDAGAGVAVVVIVVDGAGFAIAVTFGVVIVVVNFGGSRENPIKDIDGLIISTLSTGSVANFSISNRKSSFNDGRKLQLTVFRTGWKLCKESK